MPKAAQILLLLACLALTDFAFAANGRVTIAAGGKTGYVVNAPERDSFAASELIAYVEQMTGATMKRGTEGKQIVFQRGESLGLKLGPDDYAIAIRGDDIILAADTRRACLFAVYDLLERFGCRWLAPQFDFYGGTGEFVPKKSELVLELSDTIVERPHFKIRKLDIEEGLSHNTENLKQLVAWAPKLRYNTLMVPRDYNGTGRVTWAQWRAAITPEAKKRGLIIEVGGHGYENFLNAEMQDGKLFAEHPEWFGRDEKGNRSKAQRQVFCTSNQQAVDFVTKGVVEYLDATPEIEVFELWPPDGADWCTCDVCKALGEPQDRQALLINHVQKVLDKEKPGVRLEIIAYSKALLPPTKVKLDPRILVDYCPINQSFEVPINDPSSQRNAEYVAAVTAWRKQFEGDIGLYSYYRKYAWKSLPALLPHYIQADLRYYRTLPLQATMIYAEPGDWGSYEINHYALGKLSWHVEADVNAMLRTFCEARYGPEHADLAATALVTLGDTVRTLGNIPFTELKSPEQITAAREKLEKIMQSFPPDALAFTRLRLAYEYAVRDLRVQYARSAKQPALQIHGAVESLVQLLIEHKADGVFIVRGEDEKVFESTLKRYGQKLPERARPVRKTP